MLTLGLVSTLLFVSPQAHAQGMTNTTHPNFFQGIIDFIAQKFGLDKTQVQSAVNDYRSQQKANTPRPTMSPEDVAAREKTRLDQLVKDGKITSSQETAILSELATLRVKYNPDSMRNLSPQDRRTKMQQMRDEIINWAKSQGIDSSYVMSFGPMGGMGFGKGMRRGFGDWHQEITPTPTP